MIGVDFLLSELLYSLPFSDNEDFSFTKSRMFQNQSNYAAVDWCNSYYLFSLKWTRSIWPLELESGAHSIGWFIFNVHSIHVPFDRELQQNRRHLIFQKFKYFFSLLLFNFSLVLPIPPTSNWNFILTNIGSAHNGSTTSRL